MIDLGTVRPGSTIRIPFSSFDKDDGSSITMTNYAAADMLVYKDGGTTERASTAGFTATTDFDSKTGKHLAIIDLADNTTAGFWNAGSEYMVAIDAVTVDGVTTGGWIARFVIGYTDAQLNTTIATLSSQTSFTLTLGPAEDDALNGRWVIIHDIASAVQVGWGIIDDYTGSTKTVTLAAGVTFTAAAGDNISIMGVAPLQPTTIGRKLDVSAGGEAGLDWANVGSPTTTLALTGTTIATTQKVDLETIKTQTVTAAAGVTVPATIASATNITAGTITTVTNLTNAPTAGDFTATMKTSIGTAVAASAVASVTGNVGGNVTGTVGSVVGSVGSVTGAVGSVTGLTASNLDATVSSRLATAGYTAPDNTSITAIKAKTDNLPSGITKNAALNNFEFLMVLTADHVSAGTGLTVTAQRSIDGAAFGACANAVAEVGSGVYKINLAAADLNGDVVTLLFTAATADARVITLTTEA